MISINQEILDYRGHQFNRAASGYDDVSSLQLLMAQKLIALHPKTENKKALELGCGTGHLTQFLIKHHEQLIVSDISPEMLKICRNNLRQKIDIDNIDWLQLDAKAKLPQENLEIISSNALVQWIGNLKFHLRIVSEALKIGGYYLFSGFCKNNFPELNSILKENPYRVKKFPGHSLETVKTQLEDEGFVLVQAKKEEYIHHFSNVKSFIRHLKDVGATGNLQIRMTPAKMKLLEKVYVERFSDEHGIPVTWRPWYVLAKKV